MSGFLLPSIARYSPKTPLENEIIRVQLRCYLLSPEIQKINKRNHIKFVET
jgi:hypothetical protein